MKYCAALFLSAASFLNPLPAASIVEGRAPSTALDQFNTEVERLSARVAPSVVRIQSTRYSSRQENISGRVTAVVGKQLSVGSGVIVGPDGYILTNAHVVSGAEKIRVTLAGPTAPPGSRGDELITNALAETLAPSVDAKLVGLFQEMDIALIKVPRSSLPVLPFADYKKLRQGQIVFAFGSREGLGNSMSMGVVSNIARQPDLDSPFIYIQTDAAINPGDSGGPLINSAGEIVGLNTFIMTKSGGSEGIGFAIPSSLLEHVSAQLKQYGHIHRLVIGAGVQTITPALSRALGLAHDSGVVIADVFPGSPAAQAGLRLNDQILSVDGSRVDNLPLFLAKTLVHSDGVPVRLEILRKGQSFAVEVQAVREPHDAGRIEDLIDPEHSQVPRLGIVGIAIDNKTEPLLPKFRSACGVYVWALSESAPGNVAGLFAGDVIHEMNGALTPDPETLRAKLSEMKPGDAVALLVERDQKLRYVSFEVD